MADDKKKADENPKPTITDPDPDVPPAAPHETTPDVPPIAPEPKKTTTVTTTTTSDDDKSKKSKRLDRFLEKTGFDREDVDIVHENQGIFGTVQGGKYKLAKTGEVITLKGPVPTPPEEDEG